MFIFLVYFIADSAIAIGVLIGFVYGYHCFFKQCRQKRAIELRNKLSDHARKLASRHRDERSELYLSTPKECREDMKAYSAQTEKECAEIVRAVLNRDPVPYQKSSF